ncbi:MAG: hypothetical protein J3R72DRAFT_420616 [Linnemannia gamsii]|nr:MAG: hypothetical protein J3R72DRAFT_420616 [Linnemannia gamsii]
MSLYHIYMTYQQETLKLSTSQSESWYTTTTLWAFLPTSLKTGGQLDHKPGEVASEASALRKNNLEPFEAEKVDAGPQGTKSLSYSRKLAKVMNDMHDCVAVKARENIRNKLETFGLLLSRNKVTLYTLRQLPGRHYELVDGGSYTFPMA